MESRGWPASPQWMTPGHLSHSMRHPLHFAAFMQTALPLLCSITGERLNYKLRQRNNLFVQILDLRHFVIFTIQWSGRIWLYQPSSSVQRCCSILGSRSRCKNKEWRTEAVTAAGPGVGTPTIVPTLPDPASSMGTAQGTISPWRLTSRTLHQDPVF
jgi:hypothetical protein